MDRRSSEILLQIKTKNLHHIPMSASISGAHDTVHSGPFRSVNRFWPKFYTRLAIKPLSVTSVASQTDLEG